MIMSHSLLQLLNMQEFKKVLQKPPSFKNQMEVDPSTNNDHIAVFTN